MPADEQPPEWMWPFPDEITKHWKEVELERERKQDPNYTPAHDPRDRSGLVMNEA